MTETPQPRPSTDETCASCGDLLAGRPAELLPGPCRVCHECLLRAGGQDLLDWLGRVDRPVGECASIVVDNRAPAWVIPYGSGLVMMTLGACSFFPGGPPILVGLVVVAVAGSLGYGGGLLWQEVRGRPEATLTFGPDTLRRYDDSRLVGAREAVVRYGDLDLERASISFGALSLGQQRSSDGQPMQLILVGGSREAATRAAAALALLRMLQRLATEGDGHGRQGCGAAATT